MKVRSVRSAFVYGVLALAAVPMFAVSAHADREGGNTSGGGDAEQSTEMDVPGTMRGPASMFTPC